MNPESSFNAPYKMPLAFDLAFDLAFASDLWEDQKSQSVRNLEHHQNAIICLLSCRQHFRKISINPFRTYFADRHRLSHDHIGGSIKDKKTIIIIVVISNPLQSSKAAQIAFLQQVFLLSSFS